MGPEPQQARFAAISNLLTNVRLWQRHLPGVRVYFNVLIDAITLIVEDILVIKIPTLVS